MIIVLILIFVERILLPEISHVYKSYYQLKRVDYELIMFYYLLWMH